MTAGATVADSNAILADRPSNEVEVDELVEEELVVADVDEIFPERFNFISFCRSRLRAKVIYDERIKFRLDIYGWIDFKWEFWVYLALKPTKRSHYFSL